MPEITKKTIVSLIFVRFSIRNQRWKAKKVSFVPRLLDMTLLERPAPLLGRIRYVFGEGVGQHFSAQTSRGAKFSAIGPRTS